MDKYEQKAVDDIEKYGCHVINVLEGEDYPQFSYSLGIQRKTGKPDLVIIGLKSRLAQWMINEYNRRIVEGEIFETKKYYDGFLDDFQITFVRVERKHYEDHFGWGFWYNQGDSFDMLQLVFPSVDGQWPWDDDAHEDFVWLEPLLDK
jgi:hypothetical protein